MFCRKCGKAIPDDSNFCPYCGETVELAKAKDEDTPTEISEAPRMEELSSNTSGLPSDEINNDVSIIEPTANGKYPYGACSKCGEPLEADDIMICKKCVAEENQRKSNPSEYKAPKEPKNSNHHTGAIWLIATFIVSIVLLVCFGSNGNATDVSTSSSASSSVSEVQSSSIPVSSIGDTSSEDISDVKTQAEEASISWAMENMEQYGKISDEHFNGGICKGDFYAELKFRSPNVYGAKEQHDLIMKYKKGSTGWEIEGIDFDGQVISNNSKTSG